MPTRFPIVPPRTVILEGELGDRFGREWKLHVHTAAQAIALIRANRPGLDRYLAEDRHGFVCFIGERNVTQERLLGPFAPCETLRIAPAMFAAGDNSKGIWTIVAGIGLIVLSAFTFGAGAAAGTGLLGTGIGATGTAGFIANMGLALVFSGAAALLAPTPDFAEQEEQQNENKDSYLFDGPTNRSRQGKARALVYGRVMVGGDPVSQGIENEEWVDPSAADSGTTTGSGYAADAASDYAEDGAAFTTLAIFDGESHGGWVQASGGGGKGGDERKQAVEAPDTYRSIAYARVQDILGEGEQYGPLDSYGNLITTPNMLGLAVYYDQTRLRNEDGTFNFKNCRVWYQPGTPSQKFIPGSETTEVETSVGTEVTNATPVVATITDSTVDAVRVSIQFPAMYERNVGNGNVDGATVNFTIEIDYDSGGYTTVLDKTISQKNMSALVRSYRFDLSTFVTDCKIRVSRVSADETSSSIQNRIIFYSYTEIQDEHLNHPNTAKQGHVIDATQFSRIPQRAIYLGGLKVQIPDNYDPIEKTYTGAWGGAYDVQWTDNPAWIFLDLLTNVRYGLGRWITVSNVDTAALYTIAQSCDELVTEGVNRSVELVAPFALSATSIVISIPSAWIEDGDTIEFPTVADVTVNGKVRAGARDADMTAGSLIVGAKYRVTGISGGADFTNVGASANEIGKVFVATGTSPTSWGTGSLSPFYATISVDATSGAESAAGVSGVYVGREPRFTANIMLESRKDAYQVLSDFASIFRGITYWGQGTFVPVQDIAKDSVMQFTDASVIGSPKRGTTALRSRHTTAIVTYNEPDDFFRARPVYVEDPEGIAKYGVREAELAAFGCTSESQAMRIGRHKLWSERLETEPIELEVGQEAHALQVGQIFDYYSNTTATVTLAGRTRSVGVTSAELDRDVVLESGKTYSISFVKKDGTGLVSSTISTAAGTHNEVEYTAISASDLPAQIGSFIIQDTATATKKSYRLLAKKENDNGASYTLVGLEYAASKFSLIEALERDTKRAVSDSIRRCFPPSNLDVVTERISTDLNTTRYANATWNASPDVNLRSYLVTSRRGNSDWNPTQETFNTTLRLPLDAPGTYEFRVIAKNTLGVLSGPVSASFILAENGLVVGAISTPTIDPKGGVKPDGVSLTDVRLLNDEGESEVRFTVTQEEQITTGTPTSGQEYQIIDSTTSGEVLTAGATTNLREYRIKDNGGGLSDFTGVGAADNNEGTIFTANGGTPDYTGGGVLSESNNSDFELAGSANNTIGTSFTANGVAPYWGTSGELRKVTDTDPLTTSETVYTFNENWLTYSNTFTNAAWVKTNGSVTDEGVNSDPDGGKAADQISPSGSPKRIEVYQDATISNLRKGQYFTFSIYAEATNSTFAEARISIEERGGASAAAATNLDFVPSPVADGWGLHSVTHQVQQTDRTTLRVKIIAENANNPNDKFLFVYESQLKEGRARTAVTRNTSTAGGKTTVASYAGTTSVRARTFVTEDLYSAMSEQSYDFDDGATIVAEPDIRPFGSDDYEGTEFPLTITIEQLEPSAVTTYTTDGSDPALGSTYSAPFTVTSGKKVRAISTKGGMTDSEERSEDYSQGF